MFDNVDWVELSGSLLLFILVFCMSATVDVKSMKKQLDNRRAICTGIVLQFALLPFLGFLVVNLLQLDHAMGITLLVVTSSPGGSYSNWWCSLFNADMALSVTMTAISTLLSIVALPVNLLLYANHSYDDDVIASLDWVALFSALVIVISAISLGLFTSAKFDSPGFNKLSNKIGNLAGLGLILFSASISSADEDNQLWDHPWTFYASVATPCVLGVVLANILASFANLSKPERVTVAVECCYQNVGIATSVALTMFKGDELSEAMGVPLFYGICEAVVLGIYCLIAWKLNWTKAPSTDPLCRVITDNYQEFGTDISQLDEAGAEMTFEKESLQKNGDSHRDR
mmetsp:Transcript_24510/g.35975  ORF Transcript_24510/g.35975 Transcript_24510/m.35975 type:complete len:343 (-) Transcript_24510:342-1370(-)